MKNKSPISNAILTAREEGRDEGRKEILDKLRELNHDHKQLDDGFENFYFTNTIELFIKDNSTPKGGE